MREGGSACRASKGRQPGGGVLRAACALHAVRVLERWPCCACQVHVVCLRKLGARARAAGIGRVRTASLANPLLPPRPLGRSYTASSVVAGVAAQYLEAHPDAGPDEVHRSLLNWATPGTVTMAGEGALLLYSNLTDAASQLAPANESSPGNGTSAAAAGGSGGGLSAGTIAGIAVGATAGELSMVAGHSFAVPACSCQAMPRASRQEMASYKQVQSPRAAPFALLVSCCSCGMHRRPGGVCRSGPAAAAARRLRQEQQP